MAWRVIFGMFVFVVLGFARPVSAAPVVQITIDGPIGPGVSSYVSENIRDAQNGDYAAILLVMDTPGGLDTSMREIIQAILDSRLPVIGFVAPSGARAASAGTYILMATHVAAMAPGTTIGAATPVSLGGGSPQPSNPDASDDQPESGGHPGMEDKVLSDSAAYMRALAEMRDRPVDAVERFVTRAESVSDSEAMAQGIVEITAPSARALLAQANGRTVNVGGREVTLDTAQSDVEEVVPGWRDEFLALITDPNIAYLLLLIGIYGLIFEFSNPGMVAPGIAGAMALILALYALHLLPVNYAGLALIVLGLALMVSEAFVPSFGALGIGGIIAFVVGSILLLDTDIPGFRVSPYLIGTIALISSGVAMFFMTMAVRAWRRPVVSGAEGMLGTTGVVIDWSGTTGTVRTRGEIWAARSDTPVKKGNSVCVVGREGLVLEVERLPEAEGEAE